MNPFTLIEQQYSLKTLLTSNDLSALNGDEFARLANAFLLELAQKLEILPHKIRLLDAQSLNTLADTTANNSLLLIMRHGEQDPGDAINSLDDATKKSA